MDFPLFVEKYEINGRIYRRNPSKRMKSGFEQRGGDTADLYGSEEEMETTASRAEDLTSETHCSMAAESDRTDEHCECGMQNNLPNKSSKYPVVFNEKSQKWSTKIAVPHELIRFVVGAKGAVKKKIEEETTSRIIIPNKEKEQPLEVVSKSEDCVNRCRDRIELIVMSAREKAPFTHFVSFSAAVPDIQNSFAEFAKRVKEDEELSETCRDEDLFQEPEKLHFTIVMLSLLDSCERVAAAKTLTEVVEDKIRNLIGKEPLDLKVYGLEYMNDDPTKVNVLYAAVRSERVQQVADEIARSMKEAGFSRQDEDSVKLHLTLMNTRYAWEKGKRIYMDVTKLMEKYSDFDFGKFTVTEIHISSLNDPKGEDGYYRSIASIKL
ncbi:unnamed protein product [Enterobius vermicularis]|uniref:KH domain-containing protein n=1 Tax=Enterobius vermicularis TaxID=51028 RepID=A0A0N4VEQ2_ENTVE|nr:unnamed protein product [Enterobius vermicularis]